MSLRLLTSYSGVLGGAERVLLEFASVLGGERCLACPEGPLSEAARAAGIRVFPIGSRRLEMRGAARDRFLAAQRLGGFALETRTLVRDLDPDLVVACGMRSAIALLLGGRPDAPIIFQHNDLLPSTSIGRLVRVAAARADLVVVPSDAVAAELDPAARPIVIPPGVDVERFSGCGPPTEPPEVLVLGALVNWKRPDLALEACALALRRRPDLRLRIVGAPLGDEGLALMARLRERASSQDLRGAVEVVGGVPDPRPELCRATCLLHCAPREPFGLAVVEALSAGRPAVVPAAAGPAEIVDRSCGILYEPGNAQAAADAVLQLVSDPRQALRMGELGRARARARFDQSLAREQFAQVARKVVRRRPMASPSSPPALLTVTHNSASDLEALLASIEHHLPGGRVVVVDCDSSDESVAVARERNAVVLPLAENLGFGRACNRGLAEISEPVTALLNPDVELLDGSILALAAEAVRDDRPERLLAPLVLSSDGSRQDSVHPAPGSPADLAATIVSPAVARGPVGRFIAPWRSRQPRHVGWATGCALVARTQTLRRIGPFDERIFLYGEDLDLCLTAEQDGVQTWFWPSARVLHHGAHASRSAFGGEPFGLLAQARHDVVTRRLGRRRARLDDVSQAGTFASRIMVKAALGRSTAREREQLRALRRVRRTSA